MKVQFHLTVNSNGSVRTSKGRPDLKWDEVSIQMNLEVPDMLFQKPSLQAKVVIPDSAASPKMLDVEMTNNIQEAIQAVTGMQVKLTIEDNSND